MYRVWKIVGITAIVGALLILGTGFVLAQTTTPPNATPAAPWGPGGMMGGWYGPMTGRGMMGGWGGFNWGGPENSLISIAAEALDMTREELIAELEAGKTIAQVAEEQGVALETIVEAFLAPREEALQAAVEAGRITQEQADAMLAQMREHVQTRLTATWTFGQGYGPGFVDEDGDGVCDHMQNGGFGLGAGNSGRTGRGMMGRGMMGWGSSQ
jgi:hypothetical protein